MKRIIARTLGALIILLVLTVPMWSAGEWMDPLYRLSPLKSEGIWLVLLVGTALLILLLLWIINNLD